MPKGEGVPAPLPALSTGIEPQSGLPLGLLQTCILKWSRTQAEAPSVTAADQLWHCKKGGSSWLLPEDGADRLLPGFNPLKNKASSASLLTSVDA